MTSIEWLKEKLFYDFGFAFSDNIYKQAKEMHKKEMEQLPQQEISDEEIELNSASYCLTAFDGKVSNAFVNGAKWCREQLKQNL